MDNRKRRGGKMPSIDKWFKTWFESMPEPWRVGLNAALGGAAFRGDLLRRSGTCDVVVFFVPASHADAVEQLLTGEQP